MFEVGTCYETVDSLMTVLLVTKDWVTISRYSKMLELSSEDTYSVDLWPLILKYQKAVEVR
jgi:hypothetical protein